MQRGRGAIKADIGGNRARLGARIQCLGFRDLVDEAALGQNIKEIGFIGAHCCYLGGGLVACVGGWCNRSGVGFNQRARTKEVGCWG